MKWVTATKAGTNNERLVTQPMGQIKEKYRMRGLKNHGPPDIGPAGLMTGLRQACQPVLQAWAMTRKGREYVGNLIQGLVIKPMNRVARRPAR